METKHLPLDIAISVSRKGRMDKKDSDCLPTDVEEDDYFVSNVKTPLCLLICCDGVKAATRKSQASFQII